MTNKTHINYPSIDNPKSFFKELVKDGVKNQTFRAKGTVKLHGTNASIVYFANGDTQIQSRTRILNFHSDNQGFYFYVVISNKGADNFFYPPKDGKNYAVFGEFVGGNIQKGVALSGMEKQFVVFDVVEFTDNANKTFVEYDTWKDWVSPNVKTIYDFPTFDVKMTLEDIKNLYDNEHLCKLLNEVEDNCPVGCVLNPNSDNTIGEGIVWTVYTESGERLGRFKHKGDKHKRTPRNKPKSVKSFSSELQEELNNFLSQVANDDRLMQGLEAIKEQLCVDELTMRNFGDYLKWLHGDIIKEEQDAICGVLSEEVTWKTLAKHITNKAKEFYELNYE